MTQRLRPGIEDSADARAFAVVAAARPKPKDPPFPLGLLLLLCVGGPLLVAGLESLARVLADRPPTYAEPVAITRTRMLLVWDRRDADDVPVAVYALYDRRTDRERERWTFPGERTDPSLCRRSGAYVACGAEHIATGRYAVHLFGESGHIDTLETTHGSAFALDESGALAVLTVEQADPTVAELTFRSRDGTRWTRDASLGSARTPVAITQRHVVADQNVWTLSGDRRHGRDLAQLVGVSRDREEHLIVRDGALVVQAIGTEDERQGPALDGTACLLGRYERAWIMAERTGMADGPPALIAIDRDSLGMMWRAEVPEAESIECGRFTHELIAQPRTDAELPGQIVVVAIGASGADPAQAVLHGISLAGGHALWSAALRGPDLPPTVERSGSITYVIAPSERDEHLVLRFDGATLTGAVSMFARTGPRNFLEEGFWARGLRPPVFVRAPRLEPGQADGFVNDIRDDIAALGIPTS